VQTVPINYTSQIAMQGITAKYLTNGTPGTTVQVFTSTNGNAKVASNLILDLGEVKIGDSQGLSGSFYIYNGTTWVPSTSWRRGNSGSYINLYKLLTKEVLSFYRNPVERYSGTILAPYTYGTRLVWDSKYFMPTSASYNAGFDEWSGEWFAIDADETDITVSEPVDLEPVDATFTAQLSGQSGTDETIIATEIFTNNFKADNDVTVSGDTDISGALDVTGGSTLATTSVGEFTTTSRVNVTLNEITGNPGGSEEINAKNHFNFISYSGGNGNYTVNLPEAETGVIMRFKTDDTILANKTITLTPQSGERIDAETSYIMDRSYDGITLLGKDGNWYIIQKKEK